MQSHTTSKVIAFVAALVAATSAFPANQWGIAGAGNATCEHWAKATPSSKKEILSWMAGFASSESLSHAAAGSKELRLEMLSYQYLEHEIDIACVSPEKKTESMSALLIAILAKFPARE